MSIENRLTEALKESVEAKQRFWSEEKESFLAVGKLLSDTVRAKGKVLIFGNGGSACDALHFAGEWVNRYMQDRQALPCLALTADAPLLTCIGNDYSFDRIFERQLRALGRPGDVALGISTSGNSPNVILALKASRELQMKSVFLGGGAGGKILAESLADHNLMVRASRVTPRIQECHEWILHSLCEYVDFEIANWH